MDNWPDFSPDQEMISFTYENVDVDIDEQRIENWIRDVISHYNEECGTLNFLFCNNDIIHKVNREHLSHDYPTDIITFPLEDDRVSADIVISTEMVQDNADHFKVDSEQELYRVIIHGVLHLIGFDDHTEADKLVMRKAEDDALNELP